MLTKNLMFLYYIILQQCFRIANHITFVQKSYLPTIPEDVLSELMRATDGLNRYTFGTFYRKHVTFIYSRKYMYVACFI